MPVFKKLLGLFLSNTSIDVPVVSLKHVFPIIMFFKEKVSQRSDKHHDVSLVLSDVSIFRSPITTK